MTKRSSEKVLGDLLGACDAAKELVSRGRAAYDGDRLLRLPGEAIVGRIGDSSAKLRDEFGPALPETVPWAEVIGNRIVVDHSYHRVDYDALWVTLERDVPELDTTMRSWTPPRPPS